MKLITFCVPCYNSTEYMENCIDSLLVGGEDVEIILVNDGSTKDNTGEICDRYASKYPTIIKAIHQENGGHGEGVNQGIRHAKGLYYKVVDSDDWVNKEALTKVIHLLKQHIEIPLDILITNYVYEHASTNSTRVVNYRNVLPIDTCFTWEDVGTFRPSQYLLMHSVIYRTALLRDCGLELPKHTFYVDNIFVYLPLPYAKRLYYLDVDLYRYFIGREDQSVNEQIMMSRVDQQIYITELMIDAHDLNEIRQTQKKLGNYMTNYLSMMMTISSILLMKINTEESELKKDKLWHYLYKKNPRLHRTFKYRKVSAFTMFPGNLGKRISLSIYRVVKGIYKFN